MSAGLYEKYYVKKLIDPEGKHDDCSFFVLDITHDEHAVVALKTYALACQKDNPNLAADLMEMIEAHKPTL